MKSAKKILGTIAIATAVAFTCTSAMAHSAHDHSVVSYKWALSKNLKAKIESRLNSTNPASLIGLNYFEQKKLNHYEIKVGNKFNTEMRGINFLLQRTSAGMKIVDASRIGKVAYTDQVPIKKTNIFSKTSMSHKSHVGHDHTNLPYEWTFSLETQEKIVKGLIRDEENVLVGLNAFELSLLKEYEIITGNTFTTTIKGHQFLIEKTSAGIKVINYVAIADIAMASQHNENM